MLNAARHLTNLEAGDQGTSRHLSTPDTLTWSEEHSRTRVSENPKRRPTPRLLNKHTSGQPSLPHYLYSKETNQFGGMHAAHQLGSAVGLSR